MGSSLVECTTILRWCCASIGQTPRRSIRQRRRNTIITSGPRPTRRTSLSHRRAHRLLAGSRSARILPTRRHSRRTSSLRCASSRSRRSRSAVGLGLRFSSNLKTASALACSSRIAMPRNQLSRKMSMTTGRTARLRLRGCGGGRRRLRCHPFLSWVEHWLSVQGLWPPHRSRHTISYANTLGSLCTCCRITTDFWNLDIPSRIMFSYMGPHCMHSAHGIVCISLIVAEARSSLELAIVLNRSPFGRVTHITGRDLHRMRSAYSSVLVVTVATL